MSNAELEEEIQNLFENIQLIGPGNKFFGRVDDVKSVTAESLYEIAFNWREIAKTFLFTTIKGMGVFSQKIFNEGEVSLAKLGVLQSAFMIISDDLNNINPEFQKLAPKGIYGIHYIWWENTILRALKECSGNNAPLKPELMKSTLELLKGMSYLSNVPLGFAVQLRVVETIALEFVVAFRKLCSKLMNPEKNIEFSQYDYSCLDAHINAEIFHHQQVTHQSTGMVFAAEFPDEKREMLVLTREYANLWATLFDQFYETIMQAGATGLECSSVARACS